MKKLSLISFLGALFLFGCIYPDVPAPLISPLWNHYSDTYPSPLSIENTFDYSIYEYAEAIRLCYTLDGSDPHNNPNALNEDLENFSLFLSTPGTYIFRYYVYDTGEQYNFSYDETQTYIIQ